MAKEGSIEFEGVVTELLPNAMMVHIQVVGLLKY